MRVKVGVSGRHLHLKREDLEILFGEGYVLNNNKSLSQPGEFACAERVNIKVGEKNIKNMRILGPVRSYTQIEISKTDSYKLGINPPVRDSGDLETSEKVTVVGPKGEIKTNGCIIANRHIHINNNELNEYNLKNNQIVKVKVIGEKGGIMDNVIIKASDNYSFELHIDLDDANAHLITHGDILEIIGDKNE